MRRVLPADAERYRRILPLAFVGLVVAVTLLMVVSVELGIPKSWYAAPPAIVTHANGVRLTEGAPASPDADPGGDSATPTPRPTATSGTSGDGTFVGVVFTGHDPQGYPLASDTDPSLANSSDTEVYQGRKVGSSGAVGFLLAPGKYHGYTLFLFRGCGDVFSTVNALDFTVPRGARVEIAIPDSDWSSNDQPCDAGGGLGS